MSCSGSVLAIAHENDGPTEQHDKSQLFTSALPSLLAASPVLSEISEEITRSLTPR